MHGLFRKVVLVHTTLCNLRCRYCYTVIKEGEIPPVKVTYPIKPLVEELTAGGCLTPDSVVCFSGGEPTLLEEFDRLVEMVEPYTRAVQVFSNGVVFSRAIEEGLKRETVEFLVLGIDAGSPAVYLDLKGRDFCETVWSNARKYAQTGGPVIAKIVVREETARDVSTFVGRVREAGISHVYYDLDWMSSETPEVSIEAAARVHWECRRIGVTAGLMNSQNHFPGMEQRIAAALEQIENREVSA